MDYIINSMIRLIEQKIVLLIVLLVIFIGILFIPKNIYAVKTLYQIQQEYPTGSTWDQYGECLGFSRYVYDAYYGVDPYYYNENELGGYSYNVNDIQPGDVVRYNGHSVWVLEKNGNNYTVAEANYDGNNTVRWYASRTLSKMSTNFEYLLKAPYVLGTTPPVQTPPSKPANLKVYNQKDDKTLDKYSARVTWNVSTGAKYYTVDLYTKEDVDNGIFNNPVVSDHLNDNEYTFTNLRAGEYYAYIKGARYVYWEDRIIESESSRIYFKIKPFERIQITGSDLRIGETKQFTASIVPEDTTDYISLEDYPIWYSSNPSAATVDENGLVTGVGVGSTEIGLNNRNGFGYGKRINVTVTDVEDITFEKDFFVFNIYNNKIQQVKPTVHPESMIGSVWFDYECDESGLVCAGPGGNLSASCNGTGRCKIKVTAKTYRYDEVLFSKYIDAIVINYTLGDVNNDGDTNITDCTLILKYMKGLIDFDEDELKRADLNFDEVVNITDYTIYIKYLKGMTELY